MAESPELRLSGLRFGYAGGPLFLGPVDLALPSASLTAVVGPNGAGKSTLLRVVAGLHKPVEGCVTFNGLPIHTLRRHERAQTISFLPQWADVPEDLTARQLVLLGLYPHQRFQFLDSPDDIRKSEHAMQATHTMAFADRPLGTLSAGQRQRVLLAAELVQEPPLLILDEPTAALDPYHQLSIFTMLTELCGTRRLTVLTATHDLNLAARFADTVLLLDEGSVSAAGPTAEVLQPGVLQRVYGVTFETGRHASNCNSWVLPVALCPTESR